MMKLMASGLGLGVVVAGAVLMLDTRMPGSHPAPVLVASPADKFVVHDAPPPAAAPALAPAPSPAAPDPTAASGTLDAAIERLRAAKPAPPATPAPGAPDAAPTVDPLLAGPRPAPSILAGPPPPPPQNWTTVTSQGARWRPGADAAGPVLAIDMGGGRAAMVHVDPAFMTLPPTAANARVDFLKQTIQENFSPRTNEFRFSRDGSVSLLH